MTILRFRPVGLTTGHFMRKLSLILGTTLGALTLAGITAVALGSRPSVGACATAAPQAASTTYRVQAADGNCLQGHVWAPDAAPVRAAVVVVHGVHDHALRYAPLARTLNAHGIAVLAQDHRGHGASGGARQRVDSMAQLGGDVHWALKEAQKRYPGVPLFLHGHSMGGLVVAHLAAKSEIPLTGAIVSSAALKRPANASGGQIAVLRALSALAPGLPVEPINENLFVREAAARTALASDPVIDRENVPARTVAAVLAGIDGIQALMPSIQTPLLVLHGEADQVTDPEGSRQLAQQARAASLKIYPAALHDLLNEPEGAAVQQAIVDFVEARLKP
jgi:acylglycerol lipase